MNKLNVILIDDCDDIYIPLDNILNQSFTNLEVFILTCKKNLNILEPNNNKIHVVEVPHKDSILNKLIPLSASLSGEFVTFMNSSDVNAVKRFEKQILFMNLNNINICSCLEMPLDDDMYKKQTLEESNNFITSDDINSVISASYLPLDLYTFIFRKSFLTKLLYYSNYYYFSSEIDLILYFLRFESIAKVPEILYYVKNPRLPYDECLNYYLGPNTTNKLAIFNENKILDNQSYFNEIISSKRKPLRYKKTYKYSIISILNNCDIGGTESYIIDLSKKLKKENINLYILTNKCFNRELFIFYDIEFYILNLSDKNELVNTISKINNLKLIQIHMNEDISLCPLIKSIINVPLVLTIHGIYYSKKTLSNFLKYIDKIIFVSDYSKEYYHSLIKELSSEQYTTIPNGIENSLKKLTCKNTLRKSLGISKDSTIILYCSRLSYTKSTLAMLFLESFKKIAEKNQKIFAVIIGDGNYSKQIYDLSYKMNSQLDKNRIFVLRNRFNIFDYYGDCDLIIGTGRVALEAMSIGKPVISFGSNGHVNIIDNTTIKEMINSNFGDHSLSNEDLNHELIIDKLTTFISMLINPNRKTEKLGILNKVYADKYLTLNKITEFYIKMCENGSFNK